MELAIEHKNLWAWMAEDPQREKYSWPGFREFDTVRNECFACEHAYRVGTGSEDNLCEFCPLRDGAKAEAGEEFDEHQCLGGLYTAFTMEADRYRRALECETRAGKTEEYRIKATKAAERIRDLTWKD